MLRKVITVVTCVAGLFCVQPVWAQSLQQERLEHMETLAEYGKALKNNMGKRSDLLSAGAQHIINLGERWDCIKGNIIENLPKIKVMQRRDTSLNESGEEAPVPLAPVNGNDPLASFDFFTRFAGSTQSETTLGWYGQNVVVGFNDSGSYIETLFSSSSPSPSGSLSFNGWARSTNTGGTFSDKGALVADPLPPGIKYRDLGGDPVVRCSNANTFYYASLATDTVQIKASPNAVTKVFSGISVSKSTDGGNTWGGAVMAARKETPKHFLDKDWMAVVPGNKDSIYVTYTDFDSSGADDRAAIELVKSTDGGTTWSNPLVIGEVTGSDKSVQGSQIAIGPNSEVYVAWETYTYIDNNSDGNPDDVSLSIKIRKSTNGGNSFSPVKTIANIKHVGDGSLFQGVFRDGPDLQGLIVDTTNTGTKGNVYCVWNEGKNRTQAEPTSIDGKYRFADVMFSRSSDGGNVWSKPVQVNLDKQKVDHFMPAIAVDKDGKIGVIFYSRQNDTRNYLISVYFGASMDAGKTWTNKKLTQGKGFAPITGWNDYVANDTYMGDYIALTTDLSDANPGFIGAWGDTTRGDQNVLVNKISN